MFSRRLFKRQCAEVSLLNLYLEKVKDFCYRLNYLYVKLVYIPIAFLFTQLAVYSVKAYGRACSAETAAQCRTHGHMIYIYIYKVFYQGLNQFALILYTLNVKGNYQIDFPA